jgi:DNA-binding MarR family transcriptional regulator
MSETQTLPEYDAAALQTSTLQLLRRLLDAAGRVTPAVARRAGMTHHELTALELLVRDVHGPSDLARHLGVTTAAASGIVDRLVARGHVERVPHPDDRRRTQVVMTDSGRAELVSHLLPMFRSLTELDQDLDDHDRAVVDRYLAGALAAVEHIL